MQLTNEFVVPVPVPDAWAVLTDLERIAPCMPGAELDQVVGGEYHGVVKVKVGPITAQYKGRATFEEKDDVAHRAVVRAEGRDARGQGNASAVITASLAPAGTSTRVTVETDLQITGKVAQFGRGVLADVSGKILDQFVERLHADVLDSAPAQAAPATPSGAAPPPGAAALRPAASMAPLLAVAAVVTWVVCRWAGGRRRDRRTRQR